MTAISSLVGMTTEALLTGKGFTIPDLPAAVEGVARETVAEYGVLSRSLPKPKKGRVTFVDIDAFEAKPLTLDEALRVLKVLKTSDTEVWVVVQASKESQKS